MTPDSRVPHAQPRCRSAIRSLRALLDDDGTAGEVQFRPAARRRDRHRAAAAPRRPRGPPVRLPVGQRSAASLHSRRHGCQCGRHSPAVGPFSTTRMSRTRKARARADRGPGSRACLIVTDWYPAFFLPRMPEAAATQVSVRLEAVDSNGIIPVAEHGRAFPTARGYRAFMQRVLKDHVRTVPDSDPTSTLGRHARMPDVSPSIRSRWPPASAAMLDHDSGALASLPIDHAVVPAAMRGGGEAAHRRAAPFCRTQAGAIRRGPQPSRSRRIEQAVTVSSFRSGVGA